MSGSSTPENGTPTIDQARVPQERVPGLPNLDDLGTRRPDLDDEYLLGWELPDDALLHVGAGSARLTVGGERIHLLARPDRPRVWAARRMIAGLGLPADTGAIFAGSVDPSDAQPGVIHSIIESHPSWAVDRDGSSTIESRAIDALPPFDVVEERVLLESEVGAVDLLEELRRLDPPPAPPRLRVGLAEERVDFLLHVDGVEEVETRRDVDGSSRERRRVVHRWAIPGHDDEQPASSRPPIIDEAVVIATAAAGPVTVTLASIHRSHLVHVSSPSGDRSWFVPGADELTLPSEMAWARFVADQNLTGRGVISLDRNRPPTDEDAFANPTGADLVHRRVTRRWMRSVDVPIGDLCPPGPESVAEFGWSLEREPAGVEPMPAELAPMLEAMVDRAEARTTGGSPADRSVVLRERLEIVETWRGAVTTEVSYVVWPGEPAWPPLADGERVSDFVVDLTGELRRPNEARWAQLEDCESCGRKMLLGSNACPWCSELTDVDEADARRLPKELLVSGCALRWVPALEGRPLLIVGAQRLELARLDGPAVDDWITAQDADENVIRLSLGARSRLDISSDLTLGVDDAPPSVVGGGPAPPGTARVSDRISVVARYRVDSADTQTLTDGPSAAGDIAGERIDVDPNADLVAALVAHLDVGDEPVPAPAEEIRRDLLTHLGERVRAEQAASGGPAPTAMFTIDRAVTGVRVFAGSAGLREVRIAADGSETVTREAWRRRGPVVWLEPSSDGPGEAVAWAAINDTEAVVVVENGANVVVARTGDEQSRHPWPSDEEPIVLP